MNLSSLIKPFGSQSFLIGLGVAAAAYFLGPQIKEALKPVAVKGAQGVMALTEKTKDAMTQGKEKLNNVFFDKEDVGSISTVLNEFKEERIQSNKILEELKNAVTDLRNEISGMHHGGAVQES